MPDLKVIMSYEIATMNGVRILCEMSDGSKWSCNTEMKDWQKEKPNEEELTRAFNSKE